MRTPPVDVAAAVVPALVGTAFEVPTQGTSSSSLWCLWCASTQEFRRRHPTVTEAVDREHPDGCTDLTIEIDAEGRLARFDIELMEVAPELVGQPIEAVLPEVVERLTQLLR